MSSGDRIIRMLGAVAAIVLYATGTVAGVPGIVLIILAVVFALTSFVRFCPLYFLFGINTNKKKNITPNV